MRIDVFYGNETNTSIYTAYPGLYRIECWGGQGALSGGKGGYVSGYIVFRQLKKLYLYIGGEGKPGKEGAVFNNGGITQFQGGGASDVRLIEDVWDDFESLKSRIIVAGGGGGTDGEHEYSLDYGGAAGGLKGYASNANSGQPGTQENGGKGNGPGTFGKGGGNGRIGTTSNGNGGGGGGYFGGGASTNDFTNGGGGGSSYISGHEGCLAINSLSKSPTEYSMLDHSIHYSGYIFFNTEMMDGKSLMPSPFDGYETGHSSYGAIRITFLNEISCKTISFHRKINLLIVFVYIPFFSN